LLKPTEESLVPPQKRTRDFRWLLIVCAGLLPLVLGILCTAIEARHTVSQQQISTANALLAQAEKMSDNAWDMITQLRQYHYQPCEKIENQLQRVGTLNAYFRSVGLLRGEDISCSSAFGLTNGTLTQMMLQLPPLPVRPGGVCQSRGLLAYPTVQRWCLCVNCPIPLAFGQ
jgi:hypothetical protein